MSTHVEAASSCLLSEFSGSYIVGVTIFFDTTTLFLISGRIGKMGKGDVRYGPFVFQGILL
jgi:hypothetical protein